MKKKILKFLLVVFCIFPITLFASSVSNISMDIYINKNGDAHVKETWNTYNNDGTEWYKPYYNLGESKITNFKVTSDNVTYTFINSWNVDASFNQKINKNGFNYIDEGIELCWGKSSMGSKTYVIEYDISNFVVNLTDSQMIYWTLFPYDFNPTPDNIYIKVYSDFKYKDNWDVWGFGNYGGTTYIYDGYIEMNSSEDFDSSDYMVLLAKFPKNTFNTKVNLNNDFEYYLEMAEEGSTKYKESSSIDKFFSVIQTLICFSVVGITVFLSVKATYKNRIIYDYGEYKNDFKKNVLYFRDIPCNKDIFYAFSVSDAYNLLKNKNDFFGSILLKWLHDDVIKIQKENKKVLFVNTKETNIIFEKELITDNTEEKRLYNILKSQSINNVLTEKDFKKWSEDNYKFFFDYFTDVLKYESNVLCENGLLIKQQSKLGSKYQITNAYYEEAKKLYGLKKFLKDFTRIKERETIEVKLFDHYLMYAQIFGIADKVAKELKELYPNEFNGTYNYDYTDIILINNLSRNMVRAASTAKSRAESYSSGGGGFSSGGGGFGSFGGGGGGGGSR